MIKEIFEKLFQNYWLWLAGLFACIIVGFVWWQGIIKLLLMVFYAFITLSGAAIIYLAIRIYLDWKRHKQAYLQPDFVRIQGHLQEVLCKLKISNPKNGKALANLPWYLLLGDSQAGKTKLIKHSGMNFPHVIPQTAEDEIVPCTYWFEEQAILIDSCSAYFDQHEEQWVYFLRELKRLKHKVPLQGIFLVIGADNLLLEKYDNLYIKKFREKLEQIYLRLGFAIPVHVIFSKCDCIPGFIDYVKVLDSPGRDNFWGFNLNNEADLSAHISRQFAACQAKLLQLLPGQLKKMAKNKLAVCTFPQHFQRFVKKTMPVLRLLLKQNPYQETPLFSGIYFTSAITGEACDAELVENCKGYFIYAMFKHVFDLPMVIRRSRRYLGIVQLLSATTLLFCGFVLMTCYLWINTAYQKNTRLLERSVHEIQQLSVAKNDMRSVLHGFSLWRDLARQKGGIPWYLRMGFYRGELLLAPLGKQIIRAMDEVFLAKIAHYLEKQLQQQASQWQKGDAVQRQAMQGEYYLSLKAYLALCLPEVNKYENTASLLYHYWLRLFQNDLSKDKPVTTSLIDFYLDNRQHYWAMRSEIVETARAQLATLSRINYLYAQLRGLGLSQLGFLTIRDLIHGPDVDLLEDDRRIARLFTVQGWKNFVVPEIARLSRSDRNSDWVLQGFDKFATYDTMDTKQASYITQALRRLYFAEYARIWLDFLANVHLPPVDSLLEMNKVLKGVLENKISPYQQLWFSLPLTVKEVDSLKMVPELEAVFAPLRRVFSPNNQQMTFYWRNLASVQSEIEQISMSGDLSRDVVYLSAQLLNGNHNNGLFRTAAAVRALSNAWTDEAGKQAIQQHLQNPLRDIWQVLLRETAHDLQKEWQKQVYIPYQQSIAHHSLLTMKRSEGDPNELVDIIRSPDSALWQFIERDLQPFIETSHGEWQPKTWMGIGLPFVPHVLKGLSKIRHLSHGLLGQQFSETVTFEVFPIPTPGLREICFRVGAQELRYRNVPQEWQKVMWPSKNGEEEIHLWLYEDRHLGQGHLSFKGSLALLRLLKSAKLQQESGNVLRATWQIPGDSGTHYPISLLFRFKGGNDVLRELLQQQWALPKALFM